MMRLTELLEHYQKSCQKLKTVSIYLIISKLAAYGACENSLIIIQNFLSQRQLMIMLILKGLTGGHSW